MYRLGPGRKKWRAALGLVVVLALAVAFLAELVDWAALRDWMQQQNVALVLLLCATLPLFGFSVSLVYVMIGAVFGGPVGVAVVAGLTVVHLFGSHWIARSYVRAPLQRFLTRRKFHLPEVPQGGEISVALMTALVPGPPYFCRNYLLALSGIPLRIYFWICWPVYVGRSCLALFLVGFSDDFNQRRVLILAAVFVVKVTICFLLLQHLRRRRP